MTAYAPANTRPSPVTRHPSPSPVTRHRRPPPVGASLLANLPAPHSRASSLLQATGECRATRVTLDRHSAGRAKVNSVSMTADQQADTDGNLFDAEYCLCLGELVHSHLVFTGLVICLTRIA